MFSYNYFKTRYLILFLFIVTISCEDNPDLSATTVEYIARRGYPAESHTITTSDGYMLTLHRIPYSKHSKSGNIGQPIFLQHGLNQCSFDWVLADNKSLAFILSDAGYDVWMGNARGNIYSRAHVKYTKKNPKFWDFSWHEMGLYDLPAAFDYVGKKTQKQGEILYVGHSMGTTMFFVYSSIYKNANEVVKKMVALAPVAYMGDVRSPIKYLAPFVSDIEWIAKALGMNKFSPSNAILKYLKEKGCDFNTESMHLCENILFLMAGFDKDEFDLKLMPITLSHSPAGTSTKAVVHYLQEIAGNGDFRQYDYGEDENLAKYGTKNPPLYNVSEINVPLFLISGKNDWLAGPEDVSRLLSALTPSTYTSYVVPLKEFNHVDFIVAKDAPQLVYKPLLKYFGYT